VRQNGRIVGGEGWQEKVHNIEGWKLLRTARNRRILHMPMECMNKWRVCRMALLHQQSLGFWYNMVDPSFIPVTICCREPSLQCRIGEKDKLGLLCCLFACVSQNSWHSIITYLWIAKLFNNCNYTAVAGQVIAQSVSYANHCVSALQPGGCCGASVTWVKWTWATRTLGQAAKRHRGWGGHFLKRKKREYERIQ